MPEKRCPITYEVIKPGQHYSIAGLKKLSPSLKSLNPLAFTQQVLLQEAQRMASKISIQGVQPKLSARLNASKREMQLVERKGQFILKPQNPANPFIPENEDISMKLAAVIGIEIPLHGMIYGIDDKRTYFIRRFDRLPKNNKLAVEDFAQLSDHIREDKYDFTMEKIVPLIDTFATFPVLDKIEFFKRTLFNFLIGNEDMHLKNFSFITTLDGVVKLSPAYDLLNSRLMLGRKSEEIALPIGGKKRNLKKQDLIDYYGRERLQINQKEIDKILGTIHRSIQKWTQLIHQSFLPKEQQEVYLQMIKENLKRLSLV